MMIQYHFYQLVLSWNTSRCFVVLPVFTSTFIFSKSWISRRVFDRPTQQLIFESFSIKFNAIQMRSRSSIINQFNFANSSCPAQHCLRYEPTRVHFKQTPDNNSEQNCLRKQSKFLGIIMTIMSSVALFVAFICMGITCTRSGFRCRFIIFSNRYRSFTLPCIFFITLHLLNGSMYCSIYRAQPCIQCCSKTCLISHAIKSIYIQCSEYLECVSIMVLCAY
eukprot:296510_1